MYDCGGCGRALEKIDMSQRIRCPYCGYHVLYKKRLPLAKKVSAR
ncbi:MAG: DNA-directed RNA polymerase subunit P [archaeon]